MVSIPPPSDWDQSVSSALPLPPQINAALGLLSTQHHSCLSLACAVANGTGSKIPPHLCPASLESAACANSWGGLVMSLVGALLTGPSPPWLVQQRKRLWGGSCPEEHTNTTWVFHFSRPNPRASRSQRSPWLVPTAGVGPAPSLQSDANGANLFPPPVSELTLLETHASVCGWAEPCLLSLFPSVPGVTQQSVSG